MLIFFNIATVIESVFKVTTQCQEVPYVHSLKEKIQDMFERVVVKGRMGIVPT